MLNRLQTEFQNYWENILDRSPSIIIGVVLLLLFIFLGRLAKRIFINRFARKATDKLLTNFLGNLVFWIFTTIGLVFLLNAVGLGKAAAGMLAGAGLTAVILGFAFKDIGENLLSGVMMAFSRPFNIGDVIEIDTFVGTVKFLNLRNTHLRTFNGRDIYIPNSNMIKNPLINYTQDGLLRHDFIVGLDYGEAIPEVVRVINETMLSIDKIVHVDDLKPFVTVHEFATSTINLKVHFWINSKDYIGSTVVLKSEVMGKVISALVEKDFGMPADILELKIYQEGRPIPISLKKE
ncbi:MAG: mechanosensitive ion channel [Vicingaceae bacterium]